MGLQEAWWLVDQLLGLVLQLWLLEAWRVESWGQLWLQHELLLGLSPMLREEEG